MVTQGTTMTKRRGRVRQSDARSILFVDSHCDFCRRWALWIARHDRYRRIKIASLHGDTARSLLPARLRVPVCHWNADSARDECGRRGQRGALGRCACAVDSMVLRHRDGQLYILSSAVVGILSTLGGSCRIAGIGLLLIPRPIRDTLYRAVARRRRLLGKRGADLPDLAIRSTTGILTIATASVRNCAQTAPIVSLQ